MTLLLTTSCSSGRQALGLVLFRSQHLTTSAALLGSKPGKIKKAYDLDKTKAWIKKLSPEDRAYLAEAFRDEIKPVQEVNIHTCRPGGGVRL